MKKFTMILGICIFVSFMYIPLIYAEMRFGTITGPDGKIYSQFGFEHNGMEFGTITSPEGKVYQYNQFRLNNKPAPPPTYIRPYRHPLAPRGAPMGQDAINEIIKRGRRY